MRLLEILRKINAYKPITALLILLRCNNLHMSLKQRISVTSRIICAGNGSIVIGNGSHILRNVTIQSDGGKITIGNNVFINENTSIISRKKIVIGDNCSFGPNVCIYDHDHDFKNPKGGFKCSEINIGNNVWVGANVVILRGITIGNNSVVAAGTVVTKDIPEKTVMFNRRENEFISIRD